MRVLAVATDLGIDVQVPGPTGALPDQSALHGVPSRIESLGLELIEVRRIRRRAGRSAEAESWNPRETVRAE